MLRKLTRRLRALLQKDLMERELDEEVRFHLEKEIEQNLQHGMSAEEARYAALRSFGGVAQIKERCRDRRGVRAIEEIGQDLRYAARMLIKQKGLTAVAVIALALGIGANTAIFSIVNAVLLRQLPFAEPERILTLWENNVKDGIERDDVSPANFLDWRERSTLFEEMAFANPHSLDYLGDEPETWQAALVSDGFFRIFGVNALVGRTFLPEEYRAVSDRVVILSYGLWQRRFGADPKIIGQKLVLDSEPMTVVGVMPPEFKLNLFDQEKDLWAPQVFGEDLRRQRRATYLKVLARLKPGVTTERAQAEMNSIAAQLSQEYPQTNSGVGIMTVPLTEQMVGRARPALWVLSAAVGFVLLIACANIASLLLARGREREREFAIRAAIGAGRGRLIRQLLTESLLLAVAGCAGGLLLATWGIDLIIALSPGNIPRLDQVGLDRTTLAFSFATAMLTAVIFGLIPALQFSKPDLHNCLKESGQTTTGSSARHRLRSALVVAEIALALVLLVGAGLLLRSFDRLLRINPGFAMDKVVSLQVFIWDRYNTPAQRAAYAQQVLEKLEAVPGVQAVGITTALPLLESGTDTSYPFTVEGRPAAPPGGEPTIFSTIATDGYFAATGVPLLRGRLFNQFDTTAAPGVTLINDTLARRHFSDEDPVGRKITVRFTGRGQPSPTTLEIIGVVGDVRHDGLDKEPRPEFFRPYTQSPSGSIIFVVRTSADPLTLVPTLKARIWEVNPTQPFYSIATLDSLISDSLKARRFSLILLGSFAVLALALAMVGIYGVMSFTTAQRTHEIGIRMALGAQAGSVLKLVVGQGMKLTLIGVAVGLLASLALTRLMKSLLFGVSATDPLTFVMIALLLAGVSLVACYLPARRAMKVDPMVALRYE